MIGKLGGVTHWPATALENSRATDADARSRHAETLRGLLGRVLDEVEDLHPELRAAIENALKE
jgi:hypothetical protein